LGLLAVRPVLSPTRITLENNGKIRPRPDRENAFAGASGGGKGTGIQPSPILRDFFQRLQRYRCTIQAVERRSPSVMCSGTKSVTVRPDRPTVMRVTAISTQTERKRQVRSVRRAERPRSREGLLRPRDLIRPALGVSATAADTTRGEIHLFNLPNRVTFS
jgi:hypothetical protein